MNAATSLLLSLLLSAAIEDVMLMATMSPGLV